MSLTTTTTTTRLEVMSDLQRRLQPPAGQQVRFRASVGTIGTIGTTGTIGSINTLGGTTAASATTSPNPNATLTRRFSFVWPFISKEISAGTEPFLASRCSQLLRQFPAFLSGHHDESTRTIRDLISRVLTQLKAVWLVLAVYLSLLVLAVLSSAVLYTFLLAKKPPGLWFLVACIGATGAIASVSLSARNRPRRRQKPQPQQPQDAQTKLQPQPHPPRIDVN